MKGVYMIKFDEGSVYRGFEVKIGDVSTFYKSDITKYHKAANRKVFGTKETILAMAEDIKLNGQTDPIAIYQKRGTPNVIDGRNRLAALKLAGIEKVTYFNLPSNFTLAQLEEYVDSTRLRANPTKAQLAIEAYRLSKGSDITQKDASKKIGISLTQVERASRIDRLSSSALQELWDKGEYIRKDGKKTDSLAGVEADLKMRLSNAEPVEEYGSGEYNESYTQDKVIENLLEQVEKLRLELDKVKETVKKGEVLWEIKHKDED